MLNFGQQKWKTFQTNHERMPLFFFIFYHLSLYCNHQEKKWRNASAMRSVPPVYRRGQADRPADEKSL